MLKEAGEAGVCGNDTGLHLKIEEAALGDQSTLNTKSCTCKGPGAGPGWMEVT